MSEQKTRLAIDASTPVCTVALHHNAKIFSRWDKGVGIHSESVFEFTRTVLQQAQISFDDIQEVIITTGPGSYTGLRIAASAVKGMLFGTQISLFGAQTLAFFAKAGFAQKPDLKRFHAVIDARRTHLYHQLFSFQDGKIAELLPLEIREISEVGHLILDGDGIGGTGFNRLNLDEKSSNLVIFDEKQIISAEHLVQIQEEDFKANTFFSRLNPALFEPNYYTSGYAQVHQPKPKTKLNL